MQKLIWVVNSARFYMERYTELMPFDRSVGMDAVNEHLQQGWRVKSIHPAEVSGVGQASAYVLLEKNDD